MIPLQSILESDPLTFDVRSKAPGPQGTLPITAEMLLNRPSGDLFGWARTPAWAGIRSCSAAKRF